jgi:hypothetical protein
VDSYGSAGALLDQGFNTPVSAEANLEHLPPVVTDAATPPPTTIPEVLPALTNVGTGDSIFDSTPFALLVLVVGLLPLRVLRRRVIARGVPPDEQLDELPPERPKRYRHLAHSSR